MPNSCAVRCCHNTKKRTKGCIRFFRFPRDGKLRKRWILLCDRDSKFNASNAVVCSIHFLPSDYNHSVLNTHRLLGKELPRNTRILKEDAVPSINLCEDDITTSEADNPPDGEADRCPGEKVKFPRLGVQPSHSPTAQAKSSILTAREVDDLSDSKADLFSSPSLPTEMETSCHQQSTTIEDYQDTIRKLQEENLTLKQQLQKQQGKESAETNDQETSRSPTDLPEQDSPSRPDSDFGFYSFRSRSPTPRKKKKSSPLDHRAESVLAMAGDRLSALRREDEFDIVGKNVAAKLRKLPSNVEIVAEKLINDVLYEAQMGTLTPYAKLVAEQL